MKGEIYRLISPYDHPVASLSYVSPNQNDAVVYLYQLEDGRVPQVYLEGLASDADYIVEEVNLPQGRNSRFRIHKQVVSGNELMEQGIENPLSTKFESAILIFRKIND